MRLGYLGSPVSEAPNMVLGERLDVTDCVSFCETCEALFHSVMFGIWWEAQLCIFVTSSLIQTKATFVLGIDGDDFSRCCWFKKKPTA